MRNGIILAVLALMLVAVLSGGCTGNTAESRPKFTPAAVPSAIQLHEAGLDAYVRGNYSEALDLYSQAIAADPGFTRAWMDKGNALMQLNRSAEAILVYDVVLTRDPYIPDVWNNRGKALMNIGNYTAARDSFDHALEISPEFEEAKENRDLVLKKMSPNQM